jgi:hypothetical protein
VSVPSSELGPPHPLSRSECVSPLIQRRGEHTRLRVRGWGSLNSDDWRKSLALCLHFSCAQPNRLHKHIHSIQLRVNVKYEGSFFLIYFESEFESGSEIRIRNRIRNVYFGSGSDPDPAKSFGSLRIRIRFRIRNTGHQTLCVGFS